MNKNEILLILNDIFKNIADDYDDELLLETTAEDVPDWDSLNHITFIVSIEKKFKIKFTNAEIRSWENVGSIVDSIKAKID
jgi:acyl carrier protein